MILKSFSTMMYIITKNREDVELDTIYSKDMKQEIDEILKKIYHEQPWESVI